ncbi:MAG: PDZ domain-containing protein [Longimicrobiales bacterium]
MRWIPVCVAMIAAVATTSVLGAVQPLEAQQERTECRCVDADGNVLDNCSCFRSPKIEDLLSRYGVMQQRARLGVSVDQGQAARHDASGALVTDVLRDGPADRAGIRAGDVIVSLDGRSLTESIGADVEASFDLDGSAPVQRLLALVREVQPGQDVEVESLRDGELERTALEAEDLSDRWGTSAVMGPPSWDAERFRDQMRTLTDGFRTQADGLRGRTFFFGTPDLESGDRDMGIRFEGGDWRDMDVFRGQGFLHEFGGALNTRYGMEMVEPYPRLGRYFGAERGVLIVDVDVDESSELGLQPGDVILRIGDRAVTTPERLLRIVSSYGLDEELNMQVLRDGEEITVTTRLDG